MYRCAQSSEFRVYSSLPACPSPKPHTRGRVAIDRSRSRGAPRYRRVFLLVLCLTAVSQGNKHRSQSRGKPRGNRSLELIVVMELDESPLSVEAVARGVCVETGVWHTWQKGPWSPTARLDSPQCSARLFLLRRAARLHQHTCGRHGAADSTPVALCCVLSTWRDAVITRGPRRSRNFTTDVGS
jgi:hypothetical protein